MDSIDTSLEALQDIRRIMDRSSRFISLSGLSGVSAGILALAGAWLGHDLIMGYNDHNISNGVYGWDDFHSLPWQLSILALVVLLAALVAAFYFTWRKAKKNHLPFWDLTSKKLLINLLIPLITGGLFVLGMLYHENWQFITPACLIFYGLALVNASKYTLRDIRYIGLSEVVLGLVNLLYVGYGLYFWAIGFGLLHIVYGMIMWWKYDHVAS